VTLNSLPQLQVAPDAASGAPAILPIGSHGPAFAGLLGVDGKRLSLADLGEREIVVVVFTSNRCPTAKAYTDRLNALQAAYGPRGVQLVLVNSNDPHLYPDESYARMVSLSRELGYTFPYLLDEGQQLARAYGPQRTFHVFVLDRQRTLRYQGRFDDARVATSVTTPDLANALDDLLAGNPVRVPETKAFGCSLDLM
jgi:peroxiredoxin